MKLKTLFLLALTVTLAWSCTSRKPAAEYPDIIPIPYQVEISKGNFKISENTKLLVNASGDEAEEVAEYFAQKLERFLGSSFDIKAESGDQPGNSILFHIDESLNEDLGKEGYKLSVEKRRIAITAGKPAGLFYATQTILQLLPAEIYATSQKEDKPELRIPCMNITDKPSFPWRGMHLDVSRHFFPVEFVKKYIDLIALHKMNVFHWHLTDDNGWRIEIEQYPKLTEVAAWRADRTGIPWTERKQQQPGEAATYGGFYTKEEIREIVEYARQRYVTIVPEIEMPGHSSEVFAAYPEYSCKGEKLTVQTGSYWPNSDIFCAGNEGTFVFLENVLKEIMELFPSEHIHIGGDEADKSNWKTCPKCQARIKQKQLSGVEELQSYFFGRIESFIIANNRKMIGWDEIMEGGYSKRATIMSWQGFENGMKAMENGNSVIMCPTSHCYFDYYQADPDFQPKAAGGVTTLKKVYSFRQSLELAAKDNRDLLLGSQGNLWTEHVDNPEHAEYMVLPRMTALAEVLWSPADSLSWDFFKKRLEKQFSRFDHMGVNYFTGSAKVEVTALFNEDERPYSLALNTEQPGCSIYYTLDGSRPDKSSFEYIKPIRISHDVLLKAIAYKDGSWLERVNEYEIVFHNVLGGDISYLTEFSPRYPGNGPNTLNDGIKASLNFNDGLWQGFYGNNMDVIIDIGENSGFKSIIASFLLDQRRYIFIPEVVNVYLSEDGSSFQKFTELKHKIPLNSDLPLINDFSISLKKPIGVRYIRIEAVNIGSCPDWHPGKGEKAWLFADEIRIE
jgi:hexosaminidase